MFRSPSNITYPETGDLVCTMCGRVIEEKTVDLEGEWRNFEGRSPLLVTYEAVGRVRTPVSSLLQVPRTTLELEPSAPMTSHSSYRLGAINARERFSVMTQPFFSKASMISIRSWSDSALVVASMNYKRSHLSCPHYSHCLSISATGTSDLPKRI